MATGERRVIPVALALVMGSAGACTLVVDGAGGDGEPGQDGGDAGGEPGFDAGGGGGAATGSFERPFGAAGWLYDPVPADPGFDPDSDAIIARLTSGAIVANVHEFGVPFYRADASTPRLDQACDYSAEWGLCALEEFSPRPLTADMVPHTGSDLAMVVIDDSPRTAPNVGRTVDGYWLYDYNDGAPTVGYGGIADLDGPGTGEPSTGAGISRAAGVVRAAEIEAGAIEHALVFSTMYCKADAFRYPATKDDGQYEGEGGIEEGSRLQLDPDLDPDDHALSAAERAVFVALQTYGAYAIDCGGAAMAFSFEDVPGDPGAGYEAAGLTYDYFDLSAIPFASARVLAEVPPP